MMNDHTHPQFRAGQQIVDNKGRRFTVAAQVDCAVFVRGSSEWFHPSKVHAVAAVSK